MFMVVTFRGIHDLGVNVFDAGTYTSPMFPFMFFNEYVVCVGFSPIVVVVYHSSHFFALMSSKFA